MSTKRTWQTIAPRLAMAGAGLFLVILISACGYGGTSSDGGPATVSGAGAQVTMKDIAFHPADLTVNRGTTVTWTNDDGVDHTVTANDKTFDSSNVSPGQSFSFTFDQSGAFDYHCSIHPGMTGRVTVK